MGVFVLDGGFLTTIQDLGRWGFQKDGVPVGGAMDAFASRLANFLVGNDGHEAVLEITMVGPMLRFETETVVAVCGGEFACRLNEQRAPLWQPLSVKPGDVLSIGPCHHGYRGYVAFSGGLQVPLVLGSRSTYIKAAIGGLNGRPLRKGDVLSLQTHRRVPTRRFDWGIASRARSYICGSEKVVRAVAGPEHHMFTTESVQRFFTAAYEVTTQSDRMGYRLKGAELKRHTDREMLSEAVAFGTVQVPASGDPIVLMADRQTTGGYPRIAQVLSVDLPILAQARPGERIRFQKTSWQEAERLYIEREREMRQWKAAIRQKWRDTGGTN
jgi:antagonist of KipI